MHKLMFVMFFSLTYLLLHLNITMAYEKEIRSLSVALAENIAKAGKKRVAVVDFTDLQGNVTELGRFIAEEISVDFTMTAKGFEVIDRTHLRSILTEHKLSISGIVDPKTVQKLGQIAGVDAIVTGSVTPFGDSVRVTCKVIATDTARVIGASKGDIAKTKAIEELLAREIGTGMQATGETATPPSPPTKAQQRVEVKDFIFELQSCKLSGQAVSCYLTITNKGDDRQLDIGISGSYSGGTPTRMIDNYGNEYKVRLGELGSIRSNGYTTITNLMVSGIPIKAVFKFEGVSPQVSKIALLELDCGSKGAFKAQLRNIPLSK